MEVEDLENSLAVRFFLKRSKKINPSMTYENFEENKKPQTFLHSGRISNCEPMDKCNELSTSFSMMELTASDVGKNNSGEGNLPFVFPQFFRCEFCREIFLDQELHREHENAHPEKKNKNRMLFHSSKNLMV